MHFQHAFSSWELQQITDMLHVKEIAEKFLNTLLLMFIYLHVTLFRIHVEHVSTAAEKVFDIVIQMTLEQFVHWFETKEMDKKITFNKDIYKASKLLWKNDLAWWKRLFWYERNSKSFSLKRLNIRRDLEPSRTSLVELFPEIANGFHPLTILTNKLHHRCLNRF